MQLRELKQTKSVAMASISYTRESILNDTVSSNSLHKPGMCSCKEQVPFPCSNALLWIVHLIVSETTLKHVPCMSRYYAPGPC